MEGRIYFCTECGLEKHKEQVHIRYGFALRYTTNRFHRNRRVYFKVLCICKKCFHNFAVEGLMLRRKRERMLRKEEAF